MRSHHRAGQGVHGAAGRRRRPLRARAGRARAGLAGDLRSLQAGEHGGRHSAQPHGADRRSGRQARYAARLLRRRPDPLRLARSVRAPPRGAGRRQDPGGGPSWSLPLLDADRRRCRRCRSSSKIASATTSAKSAASPTTKSTPPWPPAGAIWWTSKRASSACRACGRRPISSRWPPASNASRIFWSRRNSRAAAPIDEACSKRDPEKDLYDEYRAIAGQPIENVISRLRPKVDLFFDKVLVNAPDARVRQNRLTLLNTLLREFSTIADFSEIVTNS